MVKDLLDGTDYKGDGRCMFMFVSRYDGSVHRCEKMEGHETSDDKRTRRHLITGVEWESDQEIHVGPNPFFQDLYFNIDGLWLTSGGRIVKPGSGEIAQEPADIQILTADELQYGIKLEDFKLRFKDAIKKHNRKDYLKVK
jgi:hypothetical protein